MPVSHFVTYSARELCVSLIAHAIRSICHEAGDHPYIREKLVNPQVWVDITYSPQNHEPWSKDQVKGFVLSDCYRITKYLHSTFSRPRATHFGRAGLTNWRTIVAAVYEA
jgi:hypothetical protein